jgi:hypothetical protein
VIIVAAVGALTVISVIYLHGQLNPSGAAVRVPIGPNDLSSTRYETFDQFLFEDALVSTSDPSQLSAAERTAFLRPLNAGLAKDSSRVLVLKSQPFEHSYSRFSAKVTLAEMSQRTETTVRCHAFLVHRGEESYDYRALTPREGKGRSPFKELLIPVPESETGDVLLVILAMSQQDYEASVADPGQKPLLIQLVR